MLRLLKLVSLALIIVLCVACDLKTTSNPVYSPTSTATPTLPSPTKPEPTVALILPSSQLIFRNTATGTTKDGQPIVIMTVKIIQKSIEPENTGGYYTANKMMVSRGGSLFWLRSSNTPSKFGCDQLPVSRDFTNNVQAEEDRQSYEFFGCYFGGAELTDMDKDGEPEIIAGWGHGGTSCSVNSYHFYRWDGRVYQLIDDIFEVCLHIDLQDLNNDGKLEVIARYEVGDTKWYPVPWVDVYALSNGQLIKVNQKYTHFYQDLLTQYDQLSANYKSVPEASTELQRRIEMAKVIVGQ